jgi:hypothetical protein
MRFVACLVRFDIPWCAIGGVAVEAIEKTIEILEAKGFKTMRLECSIHF